MRRPKNVKWKFNKFTSVVLGKGVPNFVNLQIFQTLQIFKSEIWDAVSGARAPTVFYTSRFVSARQVSNIGQTFKFRSTPEEKSLKNDPEKGYFSESFTIYIPKLDKTKTAREHSKFDETATSSVLKILPFFRDGKPSDATMGVPSPKC